MCRYLSCYTMKTRKAVEIMSKEVIAKANEIIHSKTAAENMGAGVTLSLFDHEGYPTTSSLSISKADGIRQILFGGSLSSNKVKRAKECSRASVCVFDDDYEKGLYYNITLVGDIEIVTDPEIKKDVWYEGLAEHFEGGVNDPDYCVLRFTTKRYNLWVDLGEEVRGSFDVQATNTLQGTSAQTAPRFEPILIYNNGQCAKAIELYKKALGAEVTAISRYSEENPEEVQYNEAQKDYIMNAQIKVGNQTLLVCDDTQNSTQAGNHIQIVLEFACEEGVRAAYNVLAEGATNLTPPHNAGYSPCVAYLTDAYGIPWQLMVWHGY